MAFSFHKKKKKLNQFRIIKQRISESNSDLHAPTSQIALMYGVVYPNIKYRILNKSTTYNTSYDTHTRYTDEIVGAKQLCPKTIKATGTHDWRRDDQLQNRESANFFFNLHAFLWSMVNRADGFGRIPAFHTLIHFHYISSS